MSVRAFSTGFATASSTGSPEMTLVAQTRIGTDRTNVCSNGNLGASDGAARSRRCQCGRSAYSLDCRCRRTTVSW